MVNQGPINLTRDKRWKLVSVGTLCVYLGFFFMFICTYCPYLQYTLTCSKSAVFLFGAATKCRIATDHRSLMSTTPAIEQTSSLQHWLQQQIWKITEEWPFSKQLSFYLRIWLCVSQSVALSLSLSLLVCPSICLCL